MAVIGYRLTSKYYITERMKLSFHPRIMKERLKEAKQQLKLIEKEPNNKDGFVVSENICLFFFNSIKCIINLIGNF